MTHLIFDGISIKNKIIKVESFDKLKTPSNNDVFVKDNLYRASNQIAEIERDKFLQTQINYNKFRFKKFIANKQINHLASSTKNCKEKNNELIPKVNHLVII